MEHHVVEYEFFLLADGFGDLSTRCAVSPPASAESTTRFAALQQQPEEERVRSCSQRSASPGWWCARLLALGHLLAVMRR